MSNSDYATQMTRYEYRLRARNNLQVPAPLLEFAYEVEVVRTRDEVLEAEGIALQDVLIDPRHLLVGEVYRGGATLALNPFNPATPELTALRLADGTGQPAAIHEMIRRSSAALQASGVPDAVGVVHPTPARAAEFSARGVIAVLPDLGNMAGWRARACAVIQEYVGALASPGVPLALDMYVDEVLVSLSAWGVTHLRGGWGSLE